MSFPKGQWFMSNGRQKLPRTTNAAEDGVGAADEVDAVVADVEAARGEAPTTKDQLG